MDNEELKKKLDILFHMTSAIICILTKNVFQYKTWQKSWLESEQDLKYYDTCYKHIPICNRCKKEKSILNYNKLNFCPNCFEEYRKENNLNV